MRSRSKYLPLLAALGFSAGTSFSQTIPRTEITTLNGQKAIFPKPFGDKPLLVLLSFSHQGADDMTNWNKRFKVPYTSDARVDYFELADFQGVPSWIMTFILHGMRRSVQEPERSHFAPMYADEDKWKNLVHFDDSKIVYVVLANAKGEVMWQTRGPASDARAMELEAAIIKIGAAAK